MKKKLCTSAINHNIRVELDLTCEEYVVLDILMENYCRQPYNWYEELIDKIGFNVDDFRRVFVPLIENKMIFTNSDSPIPVYIISERWLSRFNVDADFLEFWTLFREYGNKVSSLKNYKIVRKSVDRETLHEAAKNYLAYCDEKYSDTKYINPAQTWLDPKAKRWQDNLKMVRSQDEDAPKRVHQFV